MIPIRFHTKGDRLALAKLLLAMIVCMGGANHTAGADEVDADFGLKGPDAPLGPPTSAEPAPSQPRLTPSSILPPPGPANTGAADGTRDQDGALPPAFYPTGQAEKTPERPSTPKPKPTPPADSANANTWGGVASQPEVGSVGRDEVMWQLKDGQPPHQPPLGAPRVSQLQPANPGAPGYANRPFPLSVGGPPNPPGDPDQLGLEFGFDAAGAVFPVGGNNSWMSR